MDNVGGHECGSVLIALDVALAEVPLDLKAEQVSCELLFQLARVRRVELDTEVQQGVH